MPRRSLAASNFNLGLSSAHFFLALRRELFDILDHSSGQNHQGFAVTRFLRQSALSPHVHLANLC